MPDEVSRKYFKSIPNATTAIISATHDTTLFLKIRLIFRSKIYGTLHTAML